MSAHIDVNPALPSGAEAIDLEMLLQSGARDSLVQQREHALRVRIDLEERIAGLSCRLSQVVWYLKTIEGKLGLCQDDERSPDPCIASPRPLKRRHVGGEPAHSPPASNHNTGDRHSEARVLLPLPLSVGCHRTPALDMKPPAVFRISGGKVRMLEANPLASLPPETKPAADSSSKKLPQSSVEAYPADPTDSSISSQSNASSEQPYRPHNARMLALLSAHSMDCSSSCVSDVDSNSSIAGTNASDRSLISSVDQFERYSDQVPPPEAIKAPSPSDRAPDHAVAPSDRPNSSDSNPRVRGGKIVPGEPQRMSPKPTQPPGGLDLDTQSHHPPIAARHALDTIVREDEDELTFESQPITIPPQRPSGVDPDGGQVCQSSAPVSSSQVGDTTTTIVDHRADDLEEGELECDGSSDVAAGAASCQDTKSAPNRERLQSIAKPEASPAAPRTRRQSQIPSKDLPKSPSKASNKGHQQAVKSPHHPNLPGGKKGDTTRMSLRSHAGRPSTPARSSKASPAESPMPTKESALELQPQMQLAVKRRSKRSSAAATANTIQVDAMAGTSSASSASSQLTEARTTSSSASKLSPATSTLNQNAPDQTGLRSGSLLTAVPSASGSANMPSVPSTQPPGTRAEKQRPGGVSEPDLSRSNHPPLNLSSLLDPQIIQRAQMIQSLFQRSPQSLPSQFSSPSLPSTMPYGSPHGHTPAQPASAIHNPLMSQTMAPWSGNPADTAAPAASAFGSPQTYAPSLYSFPVFQSQVLPGNFSYPGQGVDIHRHGLSPSVPHFPYYGPGAGPWFGQ
ncbi:uncharacterized protein BJ171DRAFT_505070 [Polychytrium aggregatum]|uniref:uncharacterized protein n=1 Tax=Polychytrium aggregatum TaxID=110093 RepID=UPI0022FE1B07|nr:uncharacterized protein BJ171DRAFT_505070 [Polychytrium aggregatum]KAI9204674.1 hypothetical protein BJ171DRAFT_505070 [Polychytrium aggregatum]